MQRTDRAPMHIHPQVLVHSFRAVNFQSVPRLAESVLSDIYHSFGSSLLCELAFQNLRARETRGFDSR